MNLNLFLAQSQNKICGVLIQVVALIEYPLLT
jgi:hypothetical protein